MSRTDDVYKPALENKAIPILTLDNKWHRLFTQFAPDPRVKKRERELNELLKRQGKLTTEIKNIRRLKKKLLDEIMEYVEDLEQGKNNVGKKMEEHKRLINECNEKLGAYRDELKELPKQIDQVNYQLMLLTMEICYERIQENAAEIAELTEWITRGRTELKKKMIRKEEKEAATNALYMYMHQLFGADVIEIFDMKYIPDLEMDIKIKNPSLLPAPNQKDF